MDSSYNVQGSITVKRLRAGDNLLLQFSNNGIPLFQAVDEHSGAVNPDWTVPDNQPIVTPNAMSVRNNTVTVIWHKWWHNGVELIFDGAESGSWTTDSTGRFQMNTDGSLKIIANLASKTNLADDTLNYKTQVSVGGVEYEMDGERIITIQQMGASSYYAIIRSDTEILSSDVPSTNITTKLYQGVNEIASYYVKWFKDNELWASKNGEKSITVTRDDVGGSQLFIAEFSRSSTDTTPIARAGIKILDISDEFKVIVNIISENKEVSKGRDVVVKSKIVNMKQGADYVPDNAVWRTDIIDRESWLPLKTSNTDTITITTAETDRDGNEYDVDVVAEVMFN